MIDLTTVLVVASIFGSLLLFTMTITNFFLKRKMIDSKQLDPESLSLISKNFTSFKFDNLKWGLILLFGGIGFMLIANLPHFLREDSVLPIGVEMVMVAFGFLTYYFLVKNKVG
jgi:hypothetical protein